MSTDIVTAKQLWKICHANFRQHGSIPCHLPFLMKQALTLSLKSDKLASKPRFSVLARQDRKRNPHAYDGPYYRWNCRCSTRPVIPDSEKVGRFVSVPIHDGSPIVLMRIVPEIAGLSEDEAAEVIRQTIQRELDDRNQQYTAEVKAPFVNVKGVDTSSWLKLHPKDKGGI